MSFSFSTVLTTGFNLVWQAPGDGEPAKSSCGNSVPLEKGFCEEGERDEEEDEEGEGDGEEEEEEDEGGGGKRRRREEEKGDAATCTHTDPRALLLRLPRGCLDAAEMAPRCPATLGLLGTEAALSFLSLSG